MTAAKLLSGKGSLSALLALALGPVEPFGQRGEVEAGKILVAAGDVEMPMHQMRRRAGARQTDDAHLRPELLCDRVGDVVKRGGDAGRRIERADAAVMKDERRQLGDVLDRDMITPLLAFAEDLHRPDLVHFA